MNGLTRVNLLVGANNAGKTSVLEAAEILAAGGQPWVLLRSPTRRGDGFVPTSELQPGSRIADIRHLFHGHVLEPGVSFRIEGDAPQARFVTARVSSALSVGLDKLKFGVPLTEQEDVQPLLALIIESDGQSKPPPILPLLGGVGLSIDMVRSLPLEDEQEAPANYVDTTDLAYRFGELWDRILLTPAEERVVEALRIIEPDLDRVAPLSRATGRAQLGAIVVKLKGKDERIPLGSMGEGMKRLLVLTVNLVSAPGGLVLVDEIDTGLHFTTLTRMWKLVIEAARQFNMQVLATTHSLDCVRALAWVYEKNRDLGSEISVHRIQRGTDTAVTYGAEEILAAVEHDMEIR
jgi:hypothetical protein